MIVSSQTFLDRHAARRQAGIAALSVLVGPVAVASRLWCRWAEGKGVATVTVPAAHAAGRAWVVETARQTDLGLAAMNAIAEGTGREPQEFASAWRAKSPADAARFWEATAPLPPTSPVRRLAERVLTDPHPSPAEMATLLLPESRAEAFPILRELATLAPAVPSLLFQTPGDADGLVRVADLLAEWAFQLPAVPMAVVVPREAWEHFWNQAVPSRTTALLREGVIEIPILDEAAIAEELTAAGLNPVASGAVQALAEVGATGELLHFATEAVRSGVPPPTTPQENDRARSSAERFLFEFLESMPATAGRFELNGTLDIPFGPRPMEVDLLARQHRLAVEIDGYFHFQKPEAYRRDRAKDFALQRNGYFVVRFLAEDIVCRLELVRDRILDILSKPPSGDIP